MPQLALATAQYFENAEQQAQPPIWIPVSDLTVEVVATPPLQAELVNVTRLLGERQVASHGNNSYPTTIFELITLVEPHPQKPRGRAWKSISALTISFDRTTDEMIVEYCVEKCGLNQLDHPKRKTVKYRAPEDQVGVRLQKRLAELSAGIPTAPQ